MIVYKYIVKYTAITIAATVLLSFNQDLQKSSDIDYQILKSISKQIFDKQILCDKRTCEDPELETLSMRHREMGMQLWIKYPNDDRKFLWLLETMENEYNHITYRKMPKSKYYNQIDTSSIRKWAKEFPTYKSEFINHFNKNKDHSPLMIIAKEISNTTKFLKDSAIKQTLQIDEVRTADTILKILNSITLPADRSSMENVIYRLEVDMMFQYNKIGLSIDNIQSILSKVNSNNAPTLTKWILQKKEILQWHDYPMNIDFKSQNGKIINPSHINTSRLTLIELWTTTCSSCIERMHYLNNLVKSFPANQLQIISICLQDSSTIAEINYQINKLRNPDWNSVIGGSPKDNHSFTWFCINKLGIKGVPQYFLLDHTGKLLLYNNELINEDIKILIENLIISKQHL